MKICRLSDMERSKILRRSDRASEASETVRTILDTVRREGDSALISYTKKFDGVDISSIRVSDEEIREALSSVEPEFIAVLEKAAERIRDYHRRQKREGYIISENEGIVLGEKIVPLERVGIYVPGGSAAYPSTVLMDSIPASVALCPEIVMVTPPSRDGRVNPNVLAAASIAGVNEIYKVGGAQAVAALAYGTETIRRVDKITGPGNVFVQEAKRLVSSTVAIDMTAGPSEILIIAEDGSSPEVLASDLLGQAEHDRNATSILLCTSEKLAEDVSKEVERQLSILPRRDIASASIENNGKIIVCDSIDEAVALSNEIAPEHLELFLSDPFPELSKVKNAGSVFLGKYSPEALGDYMAGPNHTLPTNGSARFSSPLGVDDFVKRIQFTYYTREALEKDADPVALFARKEGLEGHARSALSRREYDE